MTASNLWHPCTPLGDHAAAADPLHIERGQGPWLIDREGRRYFDAISSWWVNLFGHSDARLRTAIADQLMTLPHTLLAGCTHAPAERLATALSERTGGHLGHVFFASDGSSAVEIALKMSVHHWRNVDRPAKREFVCLRGGYHGETLGSLAVTDVAIFRDAYDALLMRTHRVMSPDARQAAPGESPADVAARAAAELRGLLEMRHARIAAVIIEPLVQGAAGMAMHHPSYIQAVRALCDEFQVHLIADEIAVGGGRTGTFFAYEQAAPARPDLLCLSKGLSGGWLPLSVVMCTDAVHAPFVGTRGTAAFLHSHSYAGNPLACRAALAMLEHFEPQAGQPDALARNRTAAAALTQALAPLFADERIDHPRHLGMLWAFDVKAAHAGADFALRCGVAARRHELLLRPIGRTVYLMPPYVLDAPLARWLGERVCALLHELLLP